MIQAVRPYLFICCLLSFGCATTGDPTQGRLFGWSERDAKVLVRDQEEQMGVETAGLNAAQSRRDTNVATQKKLEKSNAELQKEIRQLDEQVAQLRARLGRDEIKRDEARKIAADILARAEATKAEAARSGSARHGKAAEELIKKARKILDEPANEGFL